LDEANEMQRYHGRMCSIVIFLIKNLLINYQITEMCLSEEEKDSIKRFCSAEIYNEDIVIKQQMAAL
jgi:hypothetical protein